MEDQYKVKWDKVREGVGCVEDKLTMTKKTLGKLSREWWIGEGKAYVES